MRNISKYLILSVMLTSSLLLANGQKIQYPVAPSDISVIDDYFGIKVKDIYRPLENDTAPETLEWVKAENKVTEAYLSKIPFRDKIRERLTQLNNYKKTGLPSKEKDGRYYYFENDGLKNQSILYRTNKIGEPAEIFLDPNNLSVDGTVALKGVYMSNDGKYTAYMVSRSGSDWNEIYVIDTETLQPLPDHIEWTKFSGVKWSKDGFYYSAYPIPEKGKEFSNANEFHQVYYHKLGTPQSEDKLVYVDKENPLHFHVAYVPESEDYLFIQASGQGAGNSLIFKNLSDNSNWITIEPSQDYAIDLIDVIDGIAYAITNYNAPKNRLVAIDLSNPKKENWIEIIPEGEGVLEGIDIAGDKMIVNISKDASNHLYVYDLHGHLINEIALPTFGTVSVAADKKSGEVNYSLTSFVYPSASFAYDMESGESTLLNAPEIQGINFNDFITEQVFYPSTDGTIIPMFITYKKGLERNGKNPVYLYGYGGFNIPLTPGFSSNRLLWLENGGIYAQANLRGGSEYGEEWHKAGTKMEKMNVFNDFISAAEYMIKEGWTSPDYIAIEGGSNGGLLVGASVNLRPELFKVAIPRVGVMDMMRYHLFTIGWNWANDYGRSDDSTEMAEYLLSYSPIHNIKNDGTPYPAIMVTTADHDDRVVPAHSFKYAATLQAADTGNAPKLIRIDSKAGHGAGKPLSKIIDEYADIYTFIFENLPKNQ